MKHQPSNHQLTLSDHVKWTKGVLPSVLICVAFSLCARATVGNDAQIAVRRLVEASRIYDEKEMANAIETLVAIGKPAVSELIAATGDVDDNVRWQSIVALGRIGNPATNSAIPCLVRSLEDCDPDVRGAACVAIGLLERRDERVIRAIQPLVKDRHGKVRADAHWSLWQLTHDSEHLPALTELMRHKDWMVYESAVRHLSSIGRPAVEYLVKSLTDSKAKNRDQAAVALGLIGPEAAVAVEPLSQTLFSKNQTLATAAEQALGRLGPTAIKPLMRIATGDDPSASIHAVNALGNCGESAAEAVPMFLNLLTDSRGALQLALIDAVGKIGPAAEPSVPVLEKLLSSSNCDIRGAACAALERIGSRASLAAADLLRLATSDPADFVRAAAAQAHHAVVNPRNVKQSTE